MRSLPARSPPPPPPPPPYALIKEYSDAAIGSCINEGFHWWSLVSKRSEPKAFEKVCEMRLLSLKRCQSTTVELKRKETVVDERTDFSDRDSLESSSRPCGLETYDRTSHPIRAWKHLQRWFGEAKKGTNLEV